MSGSENRLRAMGQPAAGSDRVWSMISTLVAGPLAWGAIGYGVGALTGISALLPIGLVFGILASFAWVIWGYTQSVNQVAGAEAKAARPPDDTPDRRGERP